MLRRNQNVVPEVEVSAAPDIGGASFGYESTRRTKSGSLSEVKVTSARQVSSLLPHVPRTNVLVARNRTRAFCPFLCGHDAPEVVEIAMAATKETIRARGLKITQLSCDLRWVPNA